MAAELRTKYGIFDGDVVAVHDGDGKSPDDLCLRLHYVAGLLWG
jgi:hypothetical protein